MVDYYQSLAQDGDTSAAVTLHTLYKYGSRLVDQNQTLAEVSAWQLLSKHWPTLLCVMFIFCLCMVYGFIVEVL